MGFFSIAPAPLLLLRAIDNHSSKFQVTEKIGLDGAVIAHSKVGATLLTAALVDTEMSCEVGMGWT